VKAVRLIFAALAVFWPTQAAFACITLAFASFDWGDPLYAPLKMEDVEITYFIGRVKSFHGETDGSGKQVAHYGDAKIQVLKSYIDDEIKPAEIQAHFGRGSCGGGLSVGQIGLFAFKMMSGKRELLRYHHRVPAE
jgi:hypothetical protein